MEATDELAELSLSPSKGSARHYLLALVAALLECGHSIDEIRAGLRSLVPAAIPADAIRRAALEEAAKVVDIFTPAQVARLWLCQFGPWNNPLNSDEAPHLPMPGHPFTCGNRSDHNHPVIAGDKGVLVPTTRGWICPICYYTQDWVHDFMVREEEKAP